MTSKPKSHLSPKRRAALLESIRMVDFPDELLEAIDDLRRTGLRPVDPDWPGHVLECSAEYHFSRMTGDGASLVPMLYSLSFKLAKNSGLFFPSMQKLARYLEIANDQALYGAAHLLVASGFWEVVEREAGRAVRYRPIGHLEWAARHSGFCTHKQEFPFKDDDDVAHFGLRLHGILGGERFFPDVLRGWLKYGTPDELCEAAKLFMKADAGQSSGVGRRVRLGAFLKTQADAGSATKNTNDVPQ